MILQSTRTLFEERQRRRIGTGIYPPYSQSAINVRRAPQYPFGYVPNNYHYRHISHAIPTADFPNYLYRDIPTLRLPVDDVVTIHEYNRNHDLNHSGVPDWREQSDYPWHRNIYDPHFGTFPNYPHAYYHYRINPILSRSQCHNI